MTTTTTTTTKTKTKHGYKIGGSCFNNILLYLNMSKNGEKNSALHAIKPKSVELFAKCSILFHEFQTDLFYATFQREKNCRNSLVNFTNIS